MKINNQRLLNIGRIFISLMFLLLTLPTWAGEGDNHLTLNAGFLFNSTLNASFGLEHQLKYDNAVEIYGEVGNRWQRDPVCGKICRDVFWKKYYWSGGVLYKKNLRRYKNSNLRLGVGAHAGAYRHKYQFGLDADLEYIITLGNDVKLSITQKNQVNFFHGDTFKNGLMLGIKIPI